VLDALRKLTVNPMCDNRIECHVAFYLHLQQVSKVQDIINACTNTTCSTCQQRPEALWRWGGGTINIINCFKIAHTQLHRLHAWHR
jgi:hypothetical protein